MLFISLSLLLWHSRFGGRGFQTVLSDGAFCDMHCGRGYSLELLKTAGRL